MKIVATHKLLDYSVQTIPFAVKISLLDIDCEIENLIG